MRSVDDAVIGRRGGELGGLAAAASFGISAPLAAALLDVADPQLLAGLLYLGAALALGVGWRGRLVPTPVLGEPLDRRSMLGSAAVIAGAGLLGGAPGEGGTGWAGVGLIAGAAVLWAGDNNVSRDVATRPPLALVTTKCAP